MEEAHGRQAAVLEVLIRRTVPGDLQLQSSPGISRGFSHHPTTTALRSAPPSAQPHLPLSFLMCLPGSLGKNVLHGLSVPESVSGEPALRLPLNCEVTGASWCGCQGVTEEGVGDEAAQRNTSRYGYLECHAQSPGSLFFFGPDSCGGLGDSSATAGYRLSSLSGLGLSLSWYLSEGV